MLNDMNYVLINNTTRLKKRLNIILVLFLFCLLFTFFYKIDYTNTFLATFIENHDKYNLKVFLPINDVSFIKNNKIVIEDKEYLYELVGMESIDSNYYILYLKIPFDSDYLKEKVISVKQNVSNKRLFDVILEKIKKGLI